MPEFVSQESNYEKLKNVFSKKKVTRDRLEQIKINFRDEISQRRYGAIVSLPDLMDCLERLDIVSESNIDALIKIAEYFPDDEIHMALEKYEEPPQLTDVNMYALQRANEINRKLGVLNEYVRPQVVSKPLIKPEFSQSRREAVYRLVARDIGRSWRFFGRELGIRSGDLDAIELKYPNNLQERVFEIFQIFEDEPTYSVKEHLHIICQALDGCRRKDLRIVVEKIMLNPDLS